MCDNCAAETLKHKNDRPYTGCILHTNNALLRSQGNVVNDSDVILHTKKCIEDKSDYKTKGNVALTPANLRALRVHLLATGDLEDLQTYTMIICGSRLFLRAQELLSIQLVHFQKDLQQINPVDGVRAITVRVKGKNDSAPVTLILYQDEEYPELCPVRHLLAYIKLAREIHPKFFESGFLFPNVDDENICGHVYYADFLCIIKHLVRDVLKRTSSTIIFGTHILRKTGYLLAIFGLLNAIKEKKTPEEFMNQGGLVNSNIMMSAR